MNSYTRKILFFSLLIAPVSVSATLPTDIQVVFRDGQFLMVDRVLLSTPQLQKIATGVHVDKGLIKKILPKNDIKEEEK